MIENNKNNYINNYEDQTQNNFNSNMQYECNRK